MLGCLWCSRGQGVCIIWWVKCSYSSVYPPSRRLWRVQNAASVSFHPQQQEVLKGVCEISHSPLVLSTSRECCAVSHDCSNPALSSVEAIERNGVQQVTCSYCSPIFVQHKYLAPFLKMRDLLDSWVFGCLVHSDIFLLRGSERDLHITVFRPAAECDDFSCLKWTNIFPRSEWVCVCVPLPLSLSLHCLTFTKNVTFS